MKNETQNSFMVYTVRQNAVSKTTDFPMDQGYKKKGYTTIR